MVCTFASPCDLSTACSCLDELPFYTCYLRGWAIYVHSITPGMSKHILQSLTRCAGSAAWAMQDIPADSIVPGQSIEWLFGDKFYVRGFIGQYIAHDGTSAIYSAALTNMLCNDTRIYFAPRAHLIKVPLTAARSTDLCRDTCTCEVDVPDAGQLALQLFLARATGRSGAMNAPADVHARFDAAMDIAPLPREFELDFVTREAEEMHIITNDPCTIGDPLVPMFTMTIPTLRCGLKPGVIVTECCEAQISGLTVDEDKAAIKEVWHPLYDGSGSDDFEED